jgi:cytochrome bd-type quinol oxidase subunit 2
MIYLASGWAFIITLLLLATEENNKTPFIIALLMIMTLFCLRAYLHLKDEHKTEAQLDIILSIIFSIASVVLVVNIIPTMKLYLKSLQNITDPVVLTFLALLVFFLLPFVIFSLITLYESLRHLKDNKINSRIVR